MELEASKWNSDRQKYKFFLQKTHREVADVSSAMETLFEYPYEIYDLSDIPGYSYDDPAKPASLTTFDATVDVSRDPGATEYKVLWQTDETRSEARALLEKDPSGGGALLRYHRQVKGVPSTPQVEYQLKGNYRRIDTELTISCTLDQSSLTRPRAIIFLHSEAEGYTELLLDLFQEEADQVILVITYLPQNFRFRIGQFGNTFLQTGYQMETDDQGDTLHRIQVRERGRKFYGRWRSGRGMLMEQRTCTRGGLVVETPTLAPTYHLLMICPAPSPELTLQVLGVEEHEGPYLRLGQISGPGGVGAQVGSGRLRPLDTPPALTLTADVEDEVMESSDWQTRSLAQFKDEFNSRWTSLAGAVRGLSSTRVRVEGALGLWPLLNDTQQLLHEALHLTTSASTYMMVKVMEEGPVDVGELLEVSGNVMREHLDPLLEVCVEALDDALGAVYNSLEEAIEAVDDLVQNIVEEVTGAYDTMEEDVTEVVEGVMETLINTLGPPLLRLQAAFNALSYNDDQSLYALVSRIMGDVRKRVGRRHGISGFFVTQLLTRLERVLVRTARWDELRARGSELLHHARNITTISFVMPHATALRLRVAMPRRLGRDLRVAGKWFLEEGGLRLLTETESWFITHWSRFRYLLTWHVRGEAVVFGWEQAITWDGRQVTPLLTDSCHHLLVLLIHARIPTAVTIHMEDLSTHPREVLTFFSGTDVVTIDSDLKMTYNWKHIRRPLLEVGELQLRLWQGRASITSDVGLSLECEHQQGLCRLAVSGDHFAATAGLLGVFDFDNYTDFMTSGWDVAATEEEWARSWRVSSSEQCSSQLPESHIPASHGHYCTDIFHASTSPFRSCFPSVAAAPYLETCRAGWECAAEAAYLHSCRRHYHDLHTNLHTNTPPAHSALPHHTLHAHLQASTTPPQPSCSTTPSKPSQPVSTPISTLALHPPQPSLSLHTPTPISKLCGSHLTTISKPYHTPRPFKLSTTPSTTISKPLPTHPPRPSPNLYHTLHAHLQASITPSTTISKPLPHPPRPYLSLYHTPTVPH
ncbi:uncharacterized protein LOC121861366 [Homarus americanus]|uniref:uncharacterized protein LOC121861366 n=1 Tax=Homarus americanus TaxID=6706 RepID=UPI001C47D245|nr:uncharacterized protein LOC121861366 [Homarus americanus]